MLENWSVGKDIHISYVRSEVLTVQCKGKTKFFLQMEIM